VTGCHGGVSLMIAPGLVCQENTSSRSASTTLEYVSPILFQPLTASTN
jgi:hypothetical protein